MDAPGVEIRHLVSVINPGAVEIYRQRFLQLRWNSEPTDYDFLGLHAQY